jgi:hypothetical protein
MTRRRVLDLPLDASMRCPFPFAIRPVFGRRND